MILGYLIYSNYEANRNKFFIDILINYARKIDINLQLLLVEKLNINIVNNETKIIYDNKLIDKPDFVIQRTMNYLLSEKFESTGIRVFNSSKLSFIADNKYNAYLKMKEIKVPVLKTFFCNKQQCPNLFYPNVTKPLCSKGGDRVNLNHNIEEYIKNVNEIKENEFILQEPSEDVGKDLRVYVIGNEIITSILRTSNSGFLSNYCKGGSASIYKLNAYEKNIVEHIVEEIKPDYVGIDFLFNKNGIVFNEIENVVGARMVYELTDINIGEKFIDYIKTQI